MICSSHNSIYYTSRMRIPHRCVCMCDLRIYAYSLYVIAKLILKAFGILKRTWSIDVWGSWKVLWRQVRRQPNHTCIRTCTRNIFIIMRYLINYYIKYVYCERGGYYRHHNTYICALHTSLFLFVPAVASAGSACAYQKFIPCILLIS